MQSASSFNAKFMTEQCQLLKNTVVEYMDQLVNARVTLKILQDHIAELQGHLKAKDKEIEDLKARLVKMENEKVCGEPQQDAA